MINTITTIINSTATLSATYGLTPYIGAFPDDASSNHLVITPLTATTAMEADNASLWESVEVEVDLYAADATNALTWGEAYAAALEDAGLCVSSKEYSYIAEQELHNFTIILSGSHYAR